MSFLVSNIGELDRGAWFLASDVRIGGYQSVYKLSTIASRTHLSQPDAKMTCLDNHPHDKHGACGSHVPPGLRKAHAQVFVRYLCTDTWSRYRIREQLYARRILQKKSGTGIAM